jgi:signal transduction histidine kinase
LKAIAESSEKMGELINGLLALSKAGQAKIHTQRVFLPELIETS